MYWLRILERQPEGLLLVENLYDVGKTKVKRVEALIESDLVYPLLRGRDVARWRAKPSSHIVMAQDPKKRVGYTESWLRITYPRSYAYLKEFEEVLRGRSGYHKYFDAGKDPFYSIYDVAEYTFAPYKVVWREQASGFTAAVAAAQDKAFVPDHKLMLVECSDLEEAHYLCSALNCSVSRLLVRSYVVETQMSTHVLQHLAIPAFSAENHVHKSLALLSQRASELAALGKEKDTELHQVEEQIDSLAAKLWGINSNELVEIKKSLQTGGKNVFQDSELPAVGK
ncbi:MAG TPA: hypothetical protein VNL15_02900 [Dehalococcoidia bacterium]|nr:hypothetical protein [Dehalococcoidia bacterium]